MQEIHIGLVAIARTTFDIELVQQGVISLSQRAGETVTALSQRSGGV